jgi:hypothetical protein
MKRSDVAIEFDGKKIESSTQLRNMAAQTVKVAMLRLYSCAAAKPLSSPPLRFNEKMIILNFQP